MQRKKIAKSPIKKNKNFRIENLHNRGSTIFNINIDTYSSRLLYYKRTNINPQFFSTIHFKTIIHHTESKSIFHTTISSLNKLTGPTSRFENTPARAKSKIQLQNRKKKPSTDQDKPQSHTKLGAHVSRRTLTSYRLWPPR